MDKSSVYERYKGVLLPGLAAMTAVIFTNPLELTKVRLQLDQELVKATGASRSYHGFLDCVRITWSKHGMSGLQRGLSVAMLREFIFNVTRIGCSYCFQRINFSTKLNVHYVNVGCYDPILTAYMKTKTDKRVTTYEQFGVGLFVGGFAGAIVNPIEIIKTRMQVCGGLTGYQHARQESFYLAAKQLFELEGINGFFKGIEIQTFRGLVGPGTQLPTYYYLKGYATERFDLDQKSPIVHAVCSIVSGGISIIFCNPPDVIRTRIYNQPFDSSGKGVYYSNSSDAFFKIIKNEGPAAFYKGAFSHFTRLGPHLMLVFVFLEQLKVMF